MAPAIKELSNGQEKGPSMQGKRLGNLNPEIVNQILSQGGASTDDLPIEEVNTDDKLLILIGGVQITTTETMTVATQQVVEAYIRRGGPVDKNPM